MLPSELNDDQWSKVTVGPWTLPFIARSIKISEETLLKHLTQDDLNAVSKFRSVKRRQEYLRVRYLFRKVYNYRGSLAKDEDGVVNLQGNALAAFSHSKGVVSCLGVASNQYWGIGLDLEHLVRMKPFLADKVCLQQDLDVVSSMAKNKSLSFRDGLAVLFAAKEALFKCHFPTGRISFYFHDAGVVDWDTKHRCLTLEVKTPTSDKSPTGHTTSILYRIRDQMVFAVAAEPIQ